MPEMPEVEALAQFLQQRTAGRTVAAVSVGTLSALKTYAPAPEALLGAAVVDVGRRGKWLDVRTVTPHDSELHLLVHLARAGWVRWYDTAPAAAVRLGCSPVALRLALDDGSGLDLTEAGTRKRLAVHLVARPEQVPAVATLGREPLELGAAELRDLLTARNQQVKGLLRDQSVIAGIGNAYSDEILHAAGTSPFALTRSFDDAAAERLHTAMVRVLRSAVDAAAGRPAAELKDTKRRSMQVHGRAGLPCPVCGDTVREVSFADSALQYCPTCQTGGRVLADRRMSRLLR
ncbi:Fpg/Nei family DNA glycosylase [Georgenia sp. 10Sc9-8]|uniref:Fpg/Nei family DNA glycosylase n=1 Tax=Georgenia halotolerans TaxID=3028317 RepID=A0ABT5TZE3_9MICO|nr:Fpg/Nei family DNA glycosylase [Georgenia halotolerans]